MASFDSYFSVVALFILFRETIEASIICGVLLQFLNRSKPALKRAVWYGVAGGVVVSIIFGIIFIAIFYTAKNSLFSGKRRDWFKGIISWIAALLITILGFAMLRFLGWEAKWKRKLAAAMKAKVPEIVALDAKDEQDSAAESTPPSDAIPGKTDKPPAAAANPSTASAARAGAARGSSSDSDDSHPQLRPPSSPDLPPSSPERATQPQPGLVTSPTLTTTATSSFSAGAAKKSPGSDDGDAKKGAATAAAAAGGMLTLSPASSAEVCYDLAKKSLPEAGLELEPIVEDTIDLTPATRRENFNIWILVFTTVVREGIESVVFLGGLGNVKLTAVPLPAFVGIVCGCLVGMFLFYTGRQVKHIKWLVISMSIVIFFIAAGQVNLGTDALMRAGLFGFCSPWLDERPWYMIPMYDWSKCCPDTDPRGDEPTAIQNRKRFFALVRAIFGYQDKGTPVEVISYCCYWGLVFILMAWKAWRGTLLDADYKYTRQQKKAEKEAAAAAAAEAAAALEGGGEGGDGADARRVVLQVEPAVAPPRLAWWRGGGGGSWRLCCSQKVVQQQL